MFERFMKWLVISSQDPSQTALSIKGILGSFVGVLILVSPLIHLNVGSDQLNTIVDSIVAFVSTALTAISAMFALWGLFRKIFMPKVVQPPQP